jgi:hypothetical protein
VARIRSFFRLFSALSLVFVSATLFGQIHGVPASVTSLGFGGRSSMTPGVAASVTSLGPNGFGGGHMRFNHCCSNPFFQTGQQSPIFFNGRHSHRNFVVGSLPFFSVPFTQVVVVQPDAGMDEDEDENYDYDGGPTVFDRRSSLTRRTRVIEVEREKEPAPAPQPVAALEPPAPVVAQASTLLVFRDGHQSELQNYAIVGDTLFDLTDNRSHKILLTDLDLLATRKANDARGVDFQVPGTPGQ